MSLVSVIIPAYNQGHYLDKAIQSVLDQTYQNFEIIVVDDGSTDNTADVAQSFSDPRIRYIYQENSGLSAARNTGIHRATGEYISFLDSDDLFLPEKLELLVSKLEDAPELGLVAGQAILIDENGQSLGEVFNKKLPKDPTRLLLANPLHVGSVMLRREWQETAGFFDETLRSYEDWDMWLRLARAGCRMGWVDRPVSQYRFHQAQMTRDGRQMTTATFAVLEKTFNDPTLPPNWQALRDPAYSQAHLRAAAQAYTARAFPTAVDHMNRAVQFNPALTDNQAIRLANQITGWAHYAKTGDPLIFLEDVYRHLPDTLSMLQQQRSQVLAQEAMRIAFETYHQKDYTATQVALRRAFRYHPGHIINRGALSLFVRAWLHI